MNPSPIEILREARKHVESLRYAFGVVGIVAAIAVITRTLSVDLRLAFFGTVVMVVLMVLLLVLNKLSKMGRSVSRAGPVLLWSFLPLPVLTAYLLFASVFFGWPLEWKLSANSKQAVSGMSGDVSKPTGMSERVTLDGHIYREDNKPLQIVVRLLDDNRKIISTRQSDEKGFIIFNIPSDSNIAMIQWDDSEPMTLSHDDCRKLKRARKFKLYPRQRRIEIQ